MKTTIIEEGIYDINTRESIKKAIFTFDGDALTRQLIGYGGDNNKIDKIDKFTFKLEVSLKDILAYNIDYDSFIEDVKIRAINIRDIYKSNIDNEMSFFDNPVVIEK